MYFMICDVKSTKSPVREKRQAILETRETHLWLMEATKNYYQLVKIRKMGTQRFIIYDPSKAALGAIIPC